MNIFQKIIIFIIKVYKYLISPFLISNCRYLPTCSDYFVDCVKLNGVIKGTFLGVKRILRCHPIKFLGAKDGFDPAPNLNQHKKGNK
tara:strand:- start:423 stop:683 length:261 start_codon:yes stop_codon:yes gene_type:complete